MQRDQELISPYGDNNHPLPPMTCKETVDTYTLEVQCLTVGSEGGKEIVSRYHRDLEAHEVVRCMREERERMSRDGETFIQFYVY